MSPGSSNDLLAYSPMLHARMFKETAKYRDHHFQPKRAGFTKVPQIDADSAKSDLYLDGNPTIDRPLTVQFCANDPNDLLEAARYVQPYCDAVDLNLGCPQGIARKGRYGAFLQEDWDTVYKLINTLYKNLDVPVTAKIRILETKEKTLEYARMVLSAGASILTVHGRQRDQKGHKTGLADWAVIRYLRENLPSETVLFANGNILRHEDMATCLKKTGADAVMSAEGNLYDPTIFAKPPPIDSEGREYWRGRDGRGGYRMDAVFRRYMDILYKYVLEISPPQRRPLFLPSDLPTSDAEPKDPECCEDEPPSKRRKRDKQPRPCSPNLSAMQPHLFHLLRPLVSQHTDVRDALAHARTGDMAAYEHVLALTEEVTKQGLMDYEAHPENYESVPMDSRSIDNEMDISENVDYESSLATVQACKRPWWVCQPYVRPLPKEALEKGSLTLGKKERKKLEVEAEEQTRITGDDIGESTRVRIDVEDGMDRAEMPKEAMVCG